MQVENKIAAAQPHPNVYLVMMLASVSSTVIVTAILLFIVSLEPWLTYLMVGGIVLSEIFVLGLFYSLYHKATHPNSTGWRAANFGGRRPDFGSESPSERR